MDTGKACVGCCADSCYEFRDFILRGNVIDLAVAIVVGGAFKEVINAFVAAFITPLLGMIQGDDAEELSFTANGAVFPYGLFITAVISFIIICFIIFYAVILPLMALLKRVYPNMVVLRSCPECLVDDLPAPATRCKYCCSSLPPLPPKVSRFAKKGDEQVTKTTTTAPGVVTTGTSGYGASAPATTAMAGGAMGGGMA